MQVFDTSEPGLANPSLTHKQRAVYEFIQRYLDEHRCSPLIREIQAACQIASYKSAIDRLGALEHKGFIRRVPNKHRGIRILRKAIEQKATAVTQTSATELAAEVPA